MDLFSRSFNDLDDPLYDGYAIEFGTDLEQPTRGVYVGVGGDVIVTMLGYSGKPGRTLTLVNVPSGALLPLRVTKVDGASSANALVGFY